jgi:hypothetical protein
MPDTEKENVKMKKLLSTLAIVFGLSAPAHALTLKCGYPHVFDSVTGDRDQSEIVWTNVVHDGNNWLVEHHKRDGHVMSRDFAEDWSVAGRSRWRGRVPEMPDTLMTGEIRLLPANKAFYQEITRSPIYFARSSAICDVLSE